MKKHIIIAIVAAAALIGCAKKEDPKPSNARMAQNEYSDFYICNNTSYKVSGQQKLYIGLTACDLSQYESKDGRTTKVQIKGMFTVQNDSINAYCYYDLKNNLFAAGNGIRSLNQMPDNSLIDYKAWTFNVKKDSVYRAIVAVSGGYNPRLELDTVTFIVRSTAITQ